MTLPSPSVPCLDEAALFTKQDLEFRTITTLLYALEYHEEITPSDFQVHSKERPYMKLLSTLSSLLVRDHEVVAILPKRSIDGTTLIVGSQEEPCHLDNVISRDPQDNDPQDEAVTLLQNHTVEVGSDINDFILKHWGQSFEYHVQAFAALLNKSLSNPSYKTKKDLRIYSLVQSAPKVHRRLSKNALLKTLQEINAATLTHSTDAVTLPPTETEMIFWALSDHKDGQSLHRKLYAFVRSSFMKDPPSHNQPPPSFAEFHNFFTWFLTKVAVEVKELRDLHTKEEAPEKLPKTVIKRTLPDLNLLCYFAWKSDFFKDYIQAASPSNGGGVATPPGKEEWGEGGVGEGVEDDEDEEDEEEVGFTEFEAGEEQSAGATANLPRHHKLILGLRLVTSNTHHLNSLLMRKAWQFSFKVIQHSQSSKDLKPWREVIQELFPESDKEDLVVKALSANCSRRFRRNFLPKGPPLVFKGRAHCEAVLASLYSMTKDHSGADMSWANISKPVLNSIRNSYNLLAPSKRCCPVCATTISYLSTKDSPRLQALSSHSAISPCAFPIGLPRAVRERLLRTYRGKLATSLKALISRVRTLSSHSQESQPLSDDEGPEGPDGMEIMDRLRSMTDELEEMSHEEAVLKWQVIRRIFSREQVGEYLTQLPEGLKAILT